MKSFTYVLLILLPVIAISADIHLITIEGSINPVTAKFVEDAVIRAEKADAAALIIQLDTPGGLLASTRWMVKRMLPAKVPIIVYIAPSGARAGSAGVFITLASHIAVMAPGTNIGAAHPVTMGGQMDSTMSKKATNDAAAFARSIAEERGRDLDWAEAAVRESASITAEDALEKGIVDFIARDIDEVLENINDRVVKLGEDEITIELDEHEIIEFQMSWREKMLDKISDPNIAYILLMLGFYGLLFELYNPGAVLPGIIGGICIILAFFAMQTLPVNTAGLLLIIFAIILFLLEIKVQSYGMLTIGGIVSLILGSIMLFRGEVEFPTMAVQVSMSVLIPVIGFTMLFFLVIIGFGIKAQNRKPDYGREALIGKEALVVKTLTPEGLVRVEGEIWRAVAESNFEIGEKLLIIGKTGMQLKVGKKDNNIIA